MKSELSTEGLGHFVMRDDDLFADIDSREGQLGCWVYCSTCKTEVWAIAHQTPHGSMWIECEKCGEGGEE